MNNWISVDEALPVEDGRYLVIEDHHYRWMGICSMKEGEFELKISHWMPLPEYPHE